MKKTSTEPPLAQSSKGTSHTPIYTAFSAPFPKNKSRRYNISIFFSPYTPSRITTKPYVKKTSTEPPLAQSSKGTSHTPIYTAFSAPFPKNKSRRYNISVFFNPYTPSRITTSGISKSPQIRFLIVLWSLNYFTVHRPATTNSIHL